MKDPLLASAEVGLMLVMVGAGGVTSGVIWEETPLFVTDVTLVGAVEVWLAGTDVALVTVAAVL